MIRVHGIPLYWGIEMDAPDRTFFTRAFLNEALPPYRDSKRAVRIRVSQRHWLHIGIFKYRTEAVKLWGIDDIQPYQIGRWGLEHDEDQEEAGDWPFDPGQQVPPVDGPGPDQLHRGADASVGGTVPWPESPRNGTSLGLGGDGDSR